MCSSIWDAKTSTMYPSFVSAVYRPQENAPIPTTTTLVHSHFTVDRSGVVLAITTPGPGAAGVATQRETAIPRSLRWNVQHCLEQDGAVKRVAEFGTKL